MPNSPPIVSHGEIIKPDQDENATTTTTTQSRLCDFCSDATAILYCRADTAKLCLSCDRQVHSTNQLFTKHTRSLLCDSCNSAPATIFCSTDTLVLCQNCDWERHNLALSSTHDRRPVEGFTGCPVVTELLSIWGFEDVSKKGLIAAAGDGFVGSASFGSDDGFSDYFVWDTPSVVSLDDLIVSSGSEHNYQAMGVPPLPKNRNAACGEHKDELLRQLCEMAKLEPNLDDEEDRIEPLGEYQAVPQQNFQFQDKCFGFQHNSEAPIYLSLEASTFQWCNETSEIADQEIPSTQLASYIETSCLVPDKDSDIGHSSTHANGGHEGQSQHPAITETVQLYPRELNSQERDTAICRYKEKKKTRRYDKHIRYESRKVRAESRTRIRGRFAKMDR